MYFPSRAKRIVRSHVQHERIDLARCYTANIPHNSTIDHGRVKPGFGSIPMIVAKDTPSGVKYGIDDFDAAEGIGTGITVPYFKLHAVAGDDRIFILEDKISHCYQRGRTDKSKRLSALRCKLTRTEPRAVQDGRAVGDVSCHGKRQPH